VSPGVEAYWLLINHELIRFANTNIDKLLVEVIKRYGPNGTDLNPETKHLSKTTLQGVKNWIPLVCDRISRAGRRREAMKLFSRWQERFHLIEKTGLMREWDEIDESQKTGIEGIMFPADGKTSYSTRKQLARLSRRQRMAEYNRILKKRIEHYPQGWKGPGEPLFLPYQLNVQYGLGSPSKFFVESYYLWKEQVQGVFGRREENDRHRRWWIPFKNRDTKRLEKLTRPLGRQRREMGDGEKLTSRERSNYNNTRLVNIMPRSMGPNVAKAKKAKTKAKAKENMNVDSADKDELDNS
jgi:hypothetical protein